MEIIKTNIEGLNLLLSTPFIDDRGEFSRIYCQKEFEQAISNEVVQINHSKTHKKGTIRGLHFQKTPYDEEKVVRCIKGSIWDVAVDLRPTSSTYLHWKSFVLKEDDHYALLIPTGFAHGFQTLEDNCEVVYFHTNFYNPMFESGLRFDDPVLNLKWPLKPTLISKKDLNYQLMDQPDEMPSLQK